MPAEMTVHIHIYQRSVLSSWDFCVSQKVKTVCVFQFCQKSCRHLLLSGIEAWPFICLPLSIHLFTHTNLFTQINVGSLNIKVCVCVREREMLIGCLLNAKHVINDNILILTIILYTIIIIPLLQVVAKVTKAQRG